MASVATLTNANGFTTLQSYIADLNPTNAASRLALTDLGIVGDDACLTWIGGVNAWQYLECSPSLSSNLWTVIYTNAPPTGVTNAVIHTGATVATNLFYRIKAHR